MFVTSTVNVVNRQELSMGFATTRARWNITTVGT